MPVQCVHTHTRANTDSTHRNFQTQTDKHTDTYIHIYKYTLRHTQNTYIHRSFQTHTCTNTQVHTHTNTHTHPQHPHTGAHTQTHTPPSTHTHHIQHRQKVSRNGPSSALLGQTPGKLGTQRRAGGQPGLQCGHLAAGQGSDRPGGGRLFVGGPCWYEWVCSTRLLLG